MAASDIADELPGKLQKVGNSLHRLAGSARAIGSTVMSPDDPYVLSQLQFNGWKADLTAYMEREMFGDKWDPAEPHPGRFLHPTEKWEMQTPLGPVKATRPEWTAFVDRIWSGVAAGLRNSVAHALTKLVRKATSDEANSLAECITTEANTIIAIKSEAVQMNANADDAGTILRVRGVSGLSRDQAEKAWKRRRTKLLEKWNARRELSAKHDTLLSKLAEPLAETDDEEKRKRETVTGWGSPANEYMALRHCCAKVMFFRNLFQEMGLLDGGAFE